MPLIGVPLLQKYKPLLFYEFDVPKAKRRTYKILDVRYLPKSSEWVSCSVPVEKGPSGEWSTQPEHLVGGSVVKARSYEYHALADVSDPGNVLYGECVDEYIDAHKKREAGRGGGAEPSAKKRRVK